MTKAIFCFLISLLALPLICRADEVVGAPEAASETGFELAAESVNRDLDESIAELNRLREQVAEETIPLSRNLRELEDELTATRQEYQQSTRMLDTHTLDLTNLRTEIESREAEVSYLSNLLGEYIRNFESSLHIAEIHRYGEPLETAKLAVENRNLSDHEVFEAQAEILDIAIDRLDEALGGARFEGTAVDSIGLVRQGTFVLVGPTAIFLSKDGQQVGTAEQRLGSLEPSIIPFADEADALAASALASASEGFMPFDATLGSAHKVEETNETFLEHVGKGGPVMIPIFALAGAALLVALLKWLQMVFVSTPTRGRIADLLGAVDQNDRAGINDQAQAIAKVRRRLLRDWVCGAVGGALVGGALHWTHRIGLVSFLSGLTDLPHGFWLCTVSGAGLGAAIEFLLHGMIGYSPTGKMLATGVAHIDEPSELLEEVMYEKVLTTRLSLQRFLPFIAISASSAPLLGLLGTVTGIINTFKLITVFGSGDVKTLSGGISEALITTEFGLIVAIPSLLLHALLSRKAKAIVDEMEKAAIALVNQVSKSRPEPQREDAMHRTLPVAGDEPGPGATSDPRLPSPAVVELTGELVDKRTVFPSLTAKQPSEGNPASDHLAAGQMDSQMVCVREDSTVSEAISQLCESGITQEADTVFVVDDNRRYIGHVLVRQLLKSPETASTGSVTDREPIFVRVDTHRDEVERKFGEHFLSSIPVLDHDDQLVGRLKRNGNGEKP